ncbi:MAG: sulfatase-like hydrolase/transferase [Chloroflexota bacterium]
MQSRPNILLITSDQQRGDCYGFAGRPVKTPHLDQLAADGTTFPACITPNPVCQPARASILTGQLPMTHGVHDNGIDLEPEVGEKGMAGSLGAAGYDTKYIGKAHFASYHTHAPEGTGTPECVKSSANYPPDWNGPYMGWEDVELLLLGHNYWDPFPPPQGQHYERWYYADGRGHKRNGEYAQQGTPKTTGAQTFHSQLPVAYHNSTWIGNQTVDFIKSRQEDDAPFLCWASFPDPHHPFDAPEPWSKLHPLDEIDLPEHRTRDFEKRPWWHKAAVEREPVGNPRMVKIRKEYSRIAPQNDDQLREIIQNYYGQISLIDHNVGRILIALEEAGIADDTIVIYTADHGDWLGDHGLVLKGPMHYEGLLRVGMIVRGPNVPAGKVVDEPVSTLDLTATFCDYAEAEPQLKQHGQSLRPLIETDPTTEAGQAASRTHAYCEWELLPARVGVRLSLRTVRTKTHKLTMDMESGAGELYDLVNDPQEMENRFDDPTIADVQAQLVAYINGRPDDMGPIRKQVGGA